MARFDTRSKGLEAGEYVVRVVSYPQIKNYSGWDKIEFEFGIEGQDRPIKQSYFPNQIKSMFVALGFKEVEPEVYDGDIQEAFGKSFLAELYFEEYKKQDGTVGKARKLRNFKGVDDCPAEPQQSVNPAGVKSPDMIAWEE